MLWNPGASAEEVARLQAVVTRLSGLTLPPFYKGYLLRLGHNDGGLRPPSHYASMKITNIIEYYEDLERDGSAAEMLPERCIVVGYTGRESRSRRASEWKVRIPLHPIRRSGRIRSLVPEDPIRDRSGATSGMMIRLRVWDLAGA